MLMQVRMPEDNLATLRTVNKHLRSALVRLRPQQQHCSAVKPQDFSDLRSEILRGAECVRRISLHPQAAAELKNESLEYRNNLEHLRQLLTELQVPAAGREVASGGRKKPSCCSRSLGRGEHEHALIEWSQ
jgi:hypothetical protein